MTRSVSRRRALSGAAGITSVGIAQNLLVACADDAPATAPDHTPDDTVSTPPATTPQPSTEVARPGNALLAAAEVPIGGGVVLGKESLVITQPVAGQFRAFSALCTHRSCLVGEVGDGHIHCPCHDSLFDAATGDVRRGPATAPLPETRVVVVDGFVARAGSGHDPAP